MERMRASEGVTETLKKTDRAITSKELPPIWKMESSSTFVHWMQFQMDMWKSGIDNNPSIMFRVILVLKVPRNRNVLRLLSKMQ